MTSKTLLKLCNTYLFLFRGVFHLFIEGHIGPYNKQKTNTLVNSVESGRTEYQMKECQRSFYPSWNLAARGGCNILWQRTECRLEFSSAFAITAQVVT